MSRGVMAAVFGMLVVLESRDIDEDGARIRTEMVDCRWRPQITEEERRRGLRYYLFMHQQR